MIPQITIPYAVADFAEIRERGFYYVDKTRFIPYLERYKAPVFLRNFLGGLGSGPILRRSITNT